MEPKEEPNDADCITSYDNFLSVICGVNVMDILEDGKVNKYNSTEGIMPDINHEINELMGFQEDSYE
mgnify:CR=1 FL=1